jgi:hypothetical protein
MLRFPDAVTQETVEITPGQEAHGVYRKLTDNRMYSPTLCLPHEDRNGASLNAKRLRKVQNLLRNPVTRWPPDLLRTGPHPLRLNQTGKAGEVQCKKLVAIATDGVQINGIRTYFLKEHAACAALSRRLFTQVPRKKPRFTRLIRATSSSAYEGSPVGR